MLFPFSTTRRSFHTSPRFILLLLPAQLFCFYLVYHPFNDVTSWSHPLPKLRWSLTNRLSPSTSQIPQWPGESNPAMVGAIVAGVLASSEVEWMEELTPNWTIHITDVNNQTTHPINKGHESMVYLNHIIDHWDTLAPVTLFIHGHLESWHQDWPMNETIGTLNLEEVKKQGFMNLRCAWEHGCPVRIETHIDPLAGTLDITSPVGEEYLVLKAIAEAFPLIFPNSTLPSLLASPCCAQFAVTRESIHRRPKQTYINMREWLYKTKYNDHTSGTVVERLWAYLLRGEGADPVFCMSPTYCRCRFFGRCDEEGGVGEYVYWGPVGRNPQSVRFKFKEEVSGVDEVEGEVKVNDGFGRDT